MGDIKFSAKKANICERLSLWDICDQLLLWNFRLNHLCIHSTNKDVDLFSSLSSLPFHFSLNSLASPSLPSFSFPCPDRGMFWKRNNFSVPNVILCWHTIHLHCILQDARVRLFHWLIARFFHPTNALLGPILSTKTIENRLRHRIQQGRPFLICIHVFTSGNKLTTNVSTFVQCCGSGSGSDRIRSFWVTRIRENTGSGFFIYKKSPVIQIFQLNKIV